MSKKYRIDTQRNRLIECDGNSFSFKRRWSSVFLKVLYEFYRRNKNLTLAELNQNLQRQGLEKHLDRTQIKRVLNDIEEIFVLSSFKGEIRYHSGHYSTIGPWNLWLEQGVELTVLKASADVADDDGLSNVAQVLAESQILKHTKGIYDIDLLNRFLNCLLQSDSLAHYGQFNDAQDFLNQCYGNTP